MKSRLIAAAVAVVLGLVGTVVLVAYVRSVNAQPAAVQVQTTEVLVAAAGIPKGTDAATFATLVTTAQLPTTAVLPNRVTDLAQIADAVALVDIDPGEPLLLSKFGVAPTGAEAGEIVAPPALQQVTIKLESRRALGGRLRPGDTVGVFISLNATTHLTLNKVLVTSVQSTTTQAAVTTDTTTEVATSATAPLPNDPNADVLITLATTGADAEQLVYAAEYGSIWLSLEPVTADESGTRIVDGSVVQQ